MAPLDIPLLLRLALQSPRIRVLLLLLILFLLSLASYLFYAHPSYRPPAPPWFEPSPSSQWPDRPPYVFDVHQAVADEAYGHGYMFTNVYSELRNSPPPSEYPCTDNDTFGPLALIGVFSMAKSWEQRAVIRALQKRGLNSRSPPIELKFILGRDPHAENQRLVEWERESFGDIVVLDCEENMNDGKTTAFFQWAASRPEGKRPRFVMKADDDTYLVLPNVLHSLSSLTCSAPIYWGTLWGSCLECFPLYMRGMAYALSWPLVRWLGSAQLSGEPTRGTEDMRTGSYLLSLPPHYPVQVVDWSEHMGDWDGTTIPHDVWTVALHKMKDPWKWTEVAHEIGKIWERAGREYAWPPTSHVEG